MRVLANLIRSREIPASFSTLTVFLSDLRLTRELGLPAQELVNVLKKF